MRPEPNPRCHRIFAWPWVDPFHTSARPRMTQWVSRVNPFHASAVFPVSSPNPTSSSSPPTPDAAPSPTHCPRTIGPPPCPRSLGGPRGAAHALDRARVAADVALPRTSRLRLARTWPPRNSPLSSSTRGASSIISPGSSRCTLHSVRIRPPPTSSSPSPAPTPFSPRAAISPAHARSEVTRSGTCASGDRGTRRGRRMATEASRLGDRGGGARFSWRHDLRQW